ncbi:NADase-type glycan-binding domain-containing protein [Actinophytocola sp.]|uniref:NADase-type glycan-binding domain-containing protein n=1 Tax=Actinophytocola sp. TaxID=1872138 RepID=UPI002ED063FF
MRSCPVCGAVVADTDDFCGNCGSYLGWGPKDERAVDPRSGGTPAPGLGDVHAARAAHVVRPGDTEPDADQPVAVQPAKPVPRRPVPRSPSGVTAQDGTPCPVCGTPNPPTRRFCRHCATPLTEAVVVTARLPWWRRLGLPRWFRRGDGPGRLRRRLVVLILLPVLVIGGIVLFPVGRGLVEDLRDKTSTPAPIGPVSVVASAEVPDHPAGDAVDGLTNRYWGAPKPGDGIEFTFDHPFRLLSLVVHAGASTKQEAFVQQARPAGLDVVVISSDGETDTLPVELADRPGPQRVDTGISDVVRIRVTVRSAVGLSDGRHIALGEIEFFQRT